MAVPKLTVNEGLAPHVLACVFAPHPLSSRCGRLLCGSSTGGPSRCEREAPHASADQHGREDRFLSSSSSSCRYVISHIVIAHTHTHKVNHMIIRLNDLLFTGICVFVCHALKAFRSCCKGFRAATQQQHQSAFPSQVVAILLF